MPARLEEAFGSGLNTMGHPNPNQLDDMMTSLNSLASLKNPEFKKSIFGNENESENESENKFSYQQSGGAGARGAGARGAGGGLCPSTDPNRPSLVRPYSGDNMFSTQSSAVASLACQALTCSPKPFDLNTGVPKARNWDEAVANQIQGTQPVPASRVTVSDCGDHFQHIWSCSECRQKLKRLLLESETPVENTVNDSPTSTVRRPQLNLQQALSGLDLPNLVYHLLLGLGLLILLDTFVRIGRRL